jgi:hypothetical protein
MQFLGDGDEGPEQAWLEFIHTGHTQQISQRHN